MEGAVRQIDGRKSVFVATRMQHPNNSLTLTKFLRHKSPCQNHFNIYQIAKNGSDTMPGINQVSGRAELFF